MARGHRDWGAVFGGPAAVVELPTYITADFVVGTPNGTRDLVSMFNPASSNRLAKIRRILAVVVFSAATYNSSIDFQIFRSTSLGTGTPATANPADTGDPPSQLQIATGLTVSPNLGVKLTHTAVQATVDITAGNGRASPLVTVVELYYHTPGSSTRPLTLLPAQGLVLRSISGPVAPTVCHYIEHTEEAV